MYRKLNKIYYLIKLFFFKHILNKDTMSIRIAYFRSKGVKIGQNVRAFSDVISAEPYLLEVGDNVTISTGVKFTTHDNSATKVIPESTDLFGRIKIGRNCFIGQSVLILPGVTLADNTIVAAGSIVTKSVKESGMIIAGNPARIVGSFEDYRVKYQTYAMNTRGLSYEEKRKLLLSSEHNLICK